MKTFNGSGLHHSQTKRSCYPVKVTRVFRALPSVPLCPLHTKATEALAFLTRLAPALDALEFEPWATDLRILLKEITP
jgi:hypothetical protein